MLRNQTQVGVLVSLFFEANAHGQTLAHSNPWSPWLLVVCILQDYCKDQMR